MEGEGENKKNGSKFTSHLHALKLKTSMEVGENKELKLKGYVSPDYQSPPSLKKKMKKQRKVQTQPQIHEEWEKNKKSGKKSYRDRETENGIGLMMGRLLVMGRKMRGQRLMPMGIPRDRSMPCRVYNGEYSQQRSLWPFPRGVQCKKDK